MKKFKLSIISSILFILLILISRNTGFDNILVKGLIYLSLVTVIGALINETYMSIHLIPEIGTGKQETTISKFIKNKRQSLGLSVQEVLQKLHNEDLELTLERYEEIESGKTDPTGDEFLKIKKILEENNQD